MPSCRVPISNNASGNNSNAMGPQIVNPGPNAPSLELQQIIRLIVEQQRQANENQIRLQEQMAKKDVDEDA